MKANRDLLRIIAASDMGDILEEFLEMKPSTYRYSQFDLLESLLETSIRSSTRSTFTHLIRYGVNLSARRLEGVLKFLFERNTQEDMETFQILYASNPCTFMANLNVILRILIDCDNFEYFKIFWSHLNETDGLTFSTLKFVLLHALNTNKMIFFNHTIASFPMTRSVSTRTFLLTHISSMMMTTTFTADSEKIKRMILDFPDQVRLEMLNVAAKFGIVCLTKIMIKQPAVKEQIDRFLSEEMKNKEISEIVSSCPWGIALANGHSRIFFEYSIRFPGIILQKEKILKHLRLKNKTKNATEKKRKN